MCGRYTLTRNEHIIEDLEAALAPAAAADPWWRPRWNVAPTQPAPVVTLRDGARAISLMRWGLVPPTPAAGKPPPLIINARRETVGVKPWFRTALARTRCLVPADGFFEWLRAARAGTPRPYYFQPPGRALCAFAGLWTRDPRDAGLDRFTIITAPANPVVRPIHDRMPIVVPADAYAAWLDPSLDGDGARALLERPAGDDWRAAPVSTWVNAAGHDDAACIAPADEPAAPQLRLFD